ncbi:hypothetical protein IWW48_001563 [Coemansia sp. RSA 1200]|nr:hypothetical protein IWW48_001563 [Coemansia sp. RSA 1200]
MLAAIASPSSATKLPLIPSQQKPAASNSARQTKSGSDQTSNPVMSNPQSNAGSATPPRLPSTGAATPKRRIATPKGLESAPDTDNTRRHVIKEHHILPENDLTETSTTAPVSADSLTHQGRPLAIPASQLDVLALVTATSPPMPSRRRWAAASGHSTSKPIVSHDRSDDSGSDTVSEDELTLRSHSARIRSRHHAAEFRPLPQKHAAMAAENNGMLDFRSADSQQHQQQQQQQQRLTMSAKPLRFHRPGASAAKPQVLNHRPPYVRRSSGETTDTDDEQQQPATDHTRAPHGRRIAGHPLLNAAMAATNGSDVAGTGIAQSMMLPVSEPAMHRRSRRRRLHEGARGVVLSKQLSKLAEETEDNDSNAGKARGEVAESRESSLSLSSSPSSPSRQQRLRKKMLRARKRAQQSGSETETDVEMVARIPGSETETEPSLSNDASTSSAGNNSANGTSVASGSGIFGGDSRGGAHRRLAGGNDTTNRLPPFADERVFRDGAMQGTGSRPVLPPIAQLDQYIQPRHRRKKSRANGINNNDGNDSGSDGDTTETDDEFFGPPNAFHSSIRPPRRVVRHLASLRAQQSRPPTALQLGGARPRPPHPIRHYLGAHDRSFSLQPGESRPINSGCTNGDAMDDAHYLVEGHSRTAPVSANGPSSEAGFGLGIGSLEGDRDYSSTGAASAQSRVISTPESAAIPGISAAVRGTPPAPAFREGGAHPSAVRSELAGGRYMRPTNGTDFPLQGSSSSMRRDFARDPFAPVADEFTFRGAALRRLEKSYVRGSALPNGHGSLSSSAAAAAAAANRKRALTAPSSYDPPGSTPGRAGPGRNIHNGIGAGGRTINSTGAFFEDEYENARGARANRSLASSNAGTPPEWNQPLDGRINPLGVSPVSSLRSSLLVQQQHQPHYHRQTIAHHPPPLSSATSPTSSVGTSNIARQRTQAARSAVAEDDLNDRPGSPSMDAAMRQNRKRQHSSGTMVLPFPDSPPLGQSNKNIDSTSTRSPTAKRRAQEERDDVEGGRRSLYKSASSSASSRSNNDIVFPSIDPDSPPN